VWLVAFDRLSAMALHQQFALSANWLYGTELKVSTHDQSPILL
jgi:hypothetical protein